MIARLTLLSAVLLPLLGCAPERPSPADGPLVEVGKAASGAVVVELRELISHPERFDGKVVRVTGILCAQFEGHALYFDYRAYQMWDYPRGIALWVPGHARTLDSSEVTVEGTFSRDYCGHAGRWDVGGIGEITFLSGRERRKEKA